MADDLDDNWYIQEKIEDNEDEVEEDENTNGSLDGAVSELHVVLPIDLRSHCYQFNITSYSLGSLIRSPYDSNAFVISGVLLFLFPCSSIP